MLYCHKLGKFSRACFPIYHEYITNISLLTLLTKINELKEWKLLDKTKWYDDRKNDDPERIKTLWIYFYPSRIKIMHGVIQNYQGWLHTYKCAKDHAAIDHTWWVNKSLIQTLSSPDWANQISLTCEHHRMYVLGKSMHTTHAHFLSCLCLKINPWSSTNRHAKQISKHEYQNHT